MRGRPAIWTHARLGGVEWNRTNAELARSLGIPTSNVGYLRVRARRLGIAAPTVHALRRERTRKRFLRAGLGRLADVQVARRLGLSRQAVHFVRRRAGIALPAEAWHSAMRRAQRARSRRMLAQSVARFGARLRRLARRGLWLTEIARRLKISSHVVGRIARALRIKLRRKKWTRAKWTAIDWRLPSSQIARRTRHSVLTVRRMRMTLRRMGYPAPHDPRRRRSRTRRPPGARP